MARDCSARIQVLIRFVRSCSAAHGACLAPSTSSRFPMGIRHDAPFRLSLATSRFDECCVPVVPRRGAELAGRAGPEPLENSHDVSKISHDVSRNVARWGCKIADTSHDGGVERAEWRPRFALVELIHPKINHAVGHLQIFDLHPVLHLVAVPPPLARFPDKYINSSGGSCILPHPLQEPHPVLHRHSLHKSSLVGFESPLSSHRFFARTTPNYVFDQPQCGTCHHPQP